MPFDPARKDMFQACREVIADMAPGQKMKPSEMHIHRQLKQGFTLDTVQLGGLGGTLTACLLIGGKDHTIHLMTDPHTAGVKYIQKVVPMNEQPPVQSSGAGALQAHREMERSTADLAGKIYALTSDQVIMDFGDKEAMDRVADAADAAIALIVEAGFDSSDSDLFGTEVSDTMQTLLMAVMLRCPQLADRLMGRDDVIIKAVDLS